MLARVDGVRVLLTEGSSLTSREVVTCLGPAGYHLEVLDPDAMCLARFSRWVRKVHRCPRAGADPMTYLQTLGTVVAERRIDVVLPTHEQAWLLATARPLWAAGVRVAVAEAAAFERVQSKIAFAGLLEQLGLPQPKWRLVDSASDLADVSFPYWLKAAFSTPGNAAASGVNIPELQVRLTLGQELPGSACVGRPGVRTHGTIALLLGSASRGGSRRSLLGNIRDAVVRRGLYADSIEQLTPVLRDPPSLAPAGFVAARLLVSPGQAAGITETAVVNYSIGPRTLAEVARSVATSSP